MDRSQEPATDPVLVPVPGLSRPLYAFAKVLFRGFLRLWFRIRVAGVDHVPDTGPVILAPNHKNFLDPFFIGIVLRRRVRYMAKSELFAGPLKWLLPRLGAFPVRRGEADEEALRTARALLAEDEVVVLFPEGTRIAEPDALGSPHHGAGRLALETSAPIVPAAITGTSHLWRGALPHLRRVQIAFLPPVDAGEVAGGEDAVEELIDRRVWPAVADSYGRLRSTPGTIAAALAAIGVGGGLIARHRLEARRHPRVLENVQPRRVRREKARRGQQGNDDA
jgi:1-acyl-sn-glycerol-3-phosphate acyltransferase